MPIDQNNCYVELVTTIDHVISAYSLNAILNFCYSVTL